MDRGTGRVFPAGQGNKGRRVRVFPVDPSLERRNRMGKLIEHDHSDDGTDRRGFLKCMAWTGTGLLWTLSGGVPKSFALGKLSRLTEVQRKSLFFAQISDSHIGFNKAANQDVTATLQAAVDKLNLLPQTPEFVIHTGDISQLSKADEFDTADQVLRGLKAAR